MKKEGVSSVIELSRCRIISIQTENRMRHFPAVAFMDNI